MMAGISDLTGMEDPLVQTQFARETNWMMVCAETCHLSHRVIGVIFEARPHVLNRSPHCVSRAGNCAILKGGSEKLADEQNAV